jgi:hypothetical protein
MENLKRNPGHAGRIWPTAWSSGLGSLLWRVGQKRSRWPNPRSIPIGWPMTPAQCGTHPRAVDALAEEVRRGWWLRDQWRRMSGMGAQAPVLEGWLNELAGGRGAARGAFCREKWLRVWRREVGALGGFSHQSGEEKGGGGWGLSAARGQVEGSVQSSAVVWAALTPTRIR